MVFLFSLPKVFNSGRTSSLKVPLINFFDIVFGNLSISASQTMTTQFLGTPIPTNNSSS